MVVSAKQNALLVQPLHHFKQTQILQQIPQSWKTLFLKDCWSCTHPRKPRWHGRTTIPNGCVTFHGCQLIKTKNNWWTVTTNLRQFCRHSTYKSVISTLPSAFIRQSFNTVLPREVRFSCKWHGVTRLPIKQVHLSLGFRPSCVREKVGANLKGVNQRLYFHNK